LEGSSPRKRVKKGGFKAIVVAWKKGAIARNYGSGGRWKPGGEGIKKSFVPTLKKGVSKTRPDWDTRVERGWKGVQSRNADANREEHHWG